MIGGQETTLFDNQLLSIKKLSQYLDVPEATIRDWVFKNLIPYVKAGRLIRFVPQDIQDWLLKKRSLP